MERLTIDGVNASTYGITPTKGAYAAVIAIPPFKTIETTDWPEYDGVEADLTAPMFDARTLTMPLAITDTDKAQQWYEAITGTNAYHTWAFPEIGMSYQLRYEQTGSFNALRKLGIISMTLAQDSPIPLVPTETQITPVSQTSTYKLDNQSIGTKYGIYILKGTDASFQKAAPAKKALTVKDPTIYGVVYDAVNPKRQSTTANIKAGILSCSLSQFWARYNSFLAQLTSAGLHTFHSSYSAAAWDIYYNSMKIDRFSVSPTGDVWCEMTISVSIPKAKPND